MEKSRVQYIDFIKTISIFIIITLHNGTWRTDFISSGSTASLVQYCIRLFCEGVPIFVFLNGFLIFDKPFNAKKHAKKTINLLVLTVLWSFIMEIYFTLMAGTPLTVIGVLTSVLETNISNSHTGVLWFLQELFIVYLIFPILKYLYDTHEKLFNYLLLVLIISTFSVSFISLIYDMFNIDILKSVLSFTKQYTLVIGTNIYVVYFMLGGYICKNKNKLPKKSLVLIGSICTVIACIIGIYISYRNGVTYRSNYNYSQVFLMFFIIAAFLLCSKIPFKNKFVNKVLMLVGDNTMGIYLLHQMVINLVSRFQIPTNSLALRLGLSMAVMIISLGITYIIRRIPKLSYIVKV